MSDISKIKVSGVEYGIKDIQAREDLGNLGNRVSAIEGKEADWNSKYSKPVDGIPKTDLASAVQTSLDKAETALQIVPNTYRTASEQDTIDSGKVDKVTGKGLSSNDYTDAAKAKVDALAPVATSGNYNDLTNKPTIPSVPKPLTYDYMPDGYPKKSVQTTTLMEEQEVTFTLSDGGPSMAQITNAFEIVEGQTYTVSWDGTEYKCVCGAAGARLYLGNPAYIGAGDNTGEPFVYAYDENTSSGAFATIETSASHTISVTRVEETITPMEEEFLPAAAKTTVFYIE